MEKLSKDTVHIKVGKKTYNFSYRKWRKRVKWEEQHLGKAK